MMTSGQGFGAGGPWAELLSLPQDKQGCVRRECPSCHRLFKVKATRLEGLLVYMKFASRLPHRNHEEADWPLAVRYCPYCGYRATDDQWFTAEQRAWLEKRADKLAEELRYEQLTLVERTLAVNPSPTFLTVRPEKPEGRPPLEPDDMRAVPMLCCQEDLKISEVWLGPVRCFFCGTEHELGSALVRHRLSRLLD